MSLSRAPKNHRSLNNGIQGGSISGVSIKGRPWMAAH